MDGDGIAEFASKAEPWPAQSSFPDGVSTHWGSVWTGSDDTLPFPFFVTTTGGDVPGARFLHPGVFDLNGDGLADFTKSVWWRAPGSTEVEFDFNEAWIRDIGTTSSSLVWQGPGTPQGDGYVLPTRLSSTSTGPHAVQFVDLNSDGLPDILRGENFNAAAGQFPAPGYESLGLWALREHGWAGNASWQIDGQVWFNTARGWSDDWSEHLRWQVDSATTLADRTPAFSIALFGRLDGAWRLADINGDGQMDFIQSFAAADGASRQGKVYLNRGGLRWVRDDSFNLPFEIVRTQGGVDVDTGLRLADVNADGLTDVLLAGPWGRQVWYNQRAVPDLLREVRSPLGAVTRIAYASQNSVGMRGCIILR
jgi:hypothetical protein